MILQIQHRYTFDSLGSMHRDPREQTYLYSGMVLYSKSNSLYMLNMYKPFSAHVYSCYLEINCTLITL